MNTNEIFYRNGKFIQEVEVPLEEILSKLNMLQEKNNLDFTLYKQLLGISRNLFEILCRIDDSQLGRTIDKFNDILLLSGEDIDDLYEKEYSLDNCFEFIRDNMKIEGRLNDVINKFC